MKNVMKYNNFLGTVEFSAEDNKLYGKIIGIEDMVMFEGDSIEEIRRNFQKAVEEYLEYCSRYNKAPVKTYKGSFNVRISPELHRTAALYAKSEGKSLNAIVEEAIREYVWKHAGPGHIG